MVRKPPGTAVFFITLPHGSFVSIHRPGFHGGTARRSIRRPLPRRRTGGRLLPGVRQLRPQLGMPAVRVRYGGVRHALRHGAARRDQNHARGAGTPGLRGGTPDPARTAAARTTAAGDGTANTADARSPTSERASTVPRGVARAPKAGPAAIRNWCGRRSKPAGSTWHARPPNCSESR